MKRHLILSADERTWKFDRPVIFLGDWCRRHDRKHVWSRMDAVDVEPYGLKISERVKDHENLKKFKTEIYPQIFNILNQVHEVKYSDRYWQIIVGDWLVRCVDLIYNRIMTLHNCLENYQISGVTLISNHEYVLAPVNSLMSTVLLDDDYWNLNLFSYIIKNID
jgi:putative transferase (TIGR04331 family)